ncbi:unnamed protein product [Anisakis simplex]|uniref:C2H2-type domain-containing protein n=1 Tax=Anisakis simplex TaxID=6269 RepID=A0A0M3K0F8_ANISI|nr:unnamed protein product [Anisakis simplex]
MEGRYVVKRARQEEEDPRLAPFEGLLRARGVEGIPCSTMLQVLTVLQVIPTDIRFKDYCLATWHVMARYAGPLTKAKITLMETTGIIPDTLITAFCRVQEVMLVVHPLHTAAPVKIYGRPGAKIVEAAEYLGSYAVLDMPTARTEEAPAPKKTPLPAIIEEEEEEEPQPGPSSRPDFPAGSISNTTLTISTDHDNSPRLTDNEITTSSPSSSTNSTTNNATQCPYNFRHPRREASPLTIRLCPRFKASNISTLTPQHASELAPTIPTPYRVTNNEVSFCTWCGHTVLVPQGLSARQIAIRMDAHRAERCVAAPKKAVVARKDAAERLQELGRDHSFIAVPGASAVEEGIERKRRRTV